jgi:hypothetical protein
MAQQGVTAAGVISLMPVIASQIGQATQTAGEGYTKTETIDGVEVQITVTSSLEGDMLRVQVELTLSGNAGAQTVRETTKGTAEMKVCPDSQGTVPLSVHLTMSSTVTSGTTTSSEQLEASAEPTGHVSDDAELTSYSTDVAVGRSSQYTDSGDPDNARHEYAEATTHTDHTMGEDLAPFRTSITRTSSQASQAIIDSASKSSFQLLDGLIASWFGAARELWQHGYCVEIVVEGAEDSNVVTPGSSTPFTARVNHKFERVELNGPIEGALSGRESLAPQGKAEAPVHYTYLAPQESASSATAALETRSRRGVAKRTLEFRTGTPNYHPIAPQPAQWSGIVCSLEQPFSLYATSAIFAGSYDFVPSNATSGSVTFRGTFGDCQDRYSGTYIIEHYTTGEPQADIIMDVKGQMICPRPRGTIPYDTQLRILLEPISDPSCP